MAITREKLALLVRHPNVAAFLRMLRKGEGTSGEQGYRTLFGGATFDSFDRHPNIRVTAGRYTSTAAGAYQFLKRTWDGLVRQYGFPDFSPASQDQGAAALIAGRGALLDVMAGRFETAVKKCAREWASLPGSPYGQPTVSTATARAVYEQWGGKYHPIEAPVLATPGETVPPVVATTEPAVTEAGPTAPVSPPVRGPAAPSLEGGYGDPTMVAPLVAAVASSAGSAFIRAAWPALASAIPSLIRLGGSSEVTERNAQIAERAVEVVMQATGARNAQEAAEVVQADPEAARAADAAVQREWFTLTEVGGGIAAAREADAQFVEGDRPLWSSPAFVLTFLFIAPVLLVIGSVMLDGALGGPQRFTDDMRSLVIGATIALLAALSGYWYGSSSGSNKKTDMLDAQRSGLR